MFEVEEVKTTPYTDQRAGTSGLRKKVTAVQQPNYLANFVQSIFTVLNGAQHGKVLVVSGDGRFYNDVAIDLILKISAANKVGRVVIGEHGTVSTPAVSRLIRMYNSAQEESKEQSPACVGGILLTASHNPGGEHGDFGIKFNAANGGPAQEHFTEAVFEASKKIEAFVNVSNLPNVNLAVAGSAKHTIKHLDGSTTDFEVEVIDRVKDYVNYMEELFDFQKIKTFVTSGSFKLCFDGMHGVSGPYARELFINRFGISEDQLMRCNILPDFGGAHPDPNLTYAPELVDILGLKDAAKEGVPDFGAACDGDADRNMILGKKFFVTPSDSLAIIVANNHMIKQFQSCEFTGAARSMPTSGALDKVIEQFQKVEETRHVQLFETPTGWKFFGNLMDAGKIQICGEESFGTGSNHIREKDGLWAVLCWLSILAHTGLSVEAIVKHHWEYYGRNYYQRYDYENIDTEVAKKVFAKITESMATFSAIDGRSAYVFKYVDPVDGSVSDNQGWIFKYADGSRFVFRQSGTGSSGTTIRLYLEKYNATEIDLDVNLALKEIIQDALAACSIVEITGMKEPTVIT